ncbi:hypothetical protein GGX14DRAFT_396733 [Mycena pura]|uniref:Uncharacterized protein n=1 Tax=Mycena pura TaxID=153505 RepID=A0AAD6V9V7_9AGAR|nr:hypothetical protein GGX14DRAFT_396733 [Mycena pura]
MEVDRGGAELGLELASARGSTSQKSADQPISGAGLEWRRHYPLAAKPKHAPVAICGAAHNIFFVIFGLILEPKIAEVVGDDEQKARLKEFAKQTYALWTSTLTMSSALPVTLMGGHSSAYLKCLYSHLMHHAASLARDPDAWWRISPESIPVHYADRLHLVQPVDRITSQLLNCTASFVTQIWSGHGLSTKESCTKLELTEGCRTLADGSKFSMGNKFKGSILTQDFMLKNALISSGGPRLDFWRPYPYRTRRWKGPYGTGTIDPYPYPYTVLYGTVTIPRPSLEARDRRNRGPRRVMGWFQRGSTERRGETVCATRRRRRVGHVAAAAAAPNRTAGEPLPDWAPINDLITSHAGITARASGVTPSCKFLGRTSCQYSNTAMICRPEHLWAPRQITHPLRYFNGMGPQPASISILRDS